MKKIVLILFLFTFGNNFAQSLWSSQYLQNIGNNYLQKIQFVNQFTGYACGGAGTLIKTTNSGINWVVLNSGTMQFITTIYFLNANTGWFGTTDSYIRKTTDGGISFTLTEVYTDPGYWPSNFSFINSQTGYVTTQTRISKTTTGGQSWALIYSSSSNLGNIQFFNEQIGYSIGLNYLSKTVNGGINWSNIFFNPSGNKDLFFLNQQTGWLLSSNLIRKTTNGGNNWTITQILLESPHSIKFTDENFGWVVGEDNGSGIILRTTNGGTNWNAQLFEPGNAFYDIFFINPNTGWASGNAVIVKTQNGTATSLNQIAFSIPNNFSLSQNCPNPFNPVTNIEFSLPQSSFVKLKVFDLLGREVQEVVNENLSAGKYKYDFNATLLPSGIYFYKLETENFVETKKMVLIK